MKKVLIIAYHFPPFGGGGVMRVLKFTKYLVRYGWQPVVLTVSNQDNYIYDTSLLNELNDSVRIYRTITLEPKLLIKKIKGFIRKQQAANRRTSTEEVVSTEGVIYQIGRLKEFLSSILLIPSEEILWNRASLKQAGKIIEQENISLVFTTSPPNSVQLFGAELKKRYALPWVADFRDAWVGNELYKPRYRFRERIEKRMEATVLSKADIIISATAPITDNFARNYPDSASRLVTLTNGFDAEYFQDINPDMDIIENRAKGKVKNNKLTITYAGSIGNIRSSGYIYEALLSIKHHHVNIYHDLQLDFFGTFCDDKRPWLANLGGCVTFNPHIPYREAVPILQKSDLLLLVAHHSEGGDTILTGKIFDYIGAGRPILGTLPQCEAQRLIEDNKLGMVVDTADAAGIASAILKAHRLWKKGALKVDTTPEFISRYERCHLTGKLALIFDHLAGAKN